LLAVRNSLHHREVFQQVERGHLRIDSKFLRQIAEDLAGLVDGLLQQNNLWDSRKKACGRYSGGMKQRFGIAQALLANAKLIIVDEPTAGLDPAERNRFPESAERRGRNVVVIHAYCGGRAVTVLAHGCLGLSPEFITRLELTSINFCLILFDADLAIGPTQFRSWP